jgi:hypothetical protein
MDILAKRGFTMITRAIILIILALSLGLVSCATYKAGQINVRAIDEYTTKTNAGGILCAADPYDTSEKAKQGFYEDVTSVGFYPIHLIFSNETGDRVMILRDSVELVDSAGNTYRSVRSNVMSDTCEHNKMSYALLGFGIFSYMSADEANKKMATDWREKEIPDQLIISPGRKTNGFVYFQLPKGKLPRGCTLRFEAEQPESRKKVPVELKL